MKINRISLILAVYMGIATIILGWEEACNEQSNRIFIMKVITIIAISVIVGIGIWFLVNSILKRFS